VSEPLIQFDNVDVRLEGEPVLTNLSWRLYPGEHWAVLGGNGAGKSTFLKLIRAEVSPAPGKGQRLYRLDGAPQCTAVGIKELIPMVSPEGQDRYLQLEWKRRVDEVIYSGFAGRDYLYARPSAAEHAIAMPLVEQFGIAHLLKRDVQLLSTGELRRILIVRALVRQPRVMLLDEVCDGLDAPTRGFLLKGLERVVHQGTQIIYTTHRRNELMPFLTNAAVLNGGKVVFAGRIAQLPRSLTVTAPASRAGAGITRPSAKCLINIKRANVYLGRKRVLRNVAWRLRDGENWAVLGSNGSGKTTFVKLVCGDVHATIGSRVERFDFTARSTLWDLRKRIGFISPALQASYRERLTGAEVVASGFFYSIGLLDRVTKRQRGRVEALLEIFRAGKLAARPILRMSYGELRIVLLLRALVHEPAILVCDEPFDGLDSAAKEAFSAALDRVAANGTRLVTVTHHIDELPRSTTHALLLENGCIACQGELEQVRAHEAARRLFGHER
jgi:molybdate transport system ATP-binding protein